MVKPRPLLLTLVFVLVLTTLVQTAVAQPVFHLEAEGVKIWINQDGTIDLFYNITIAWDSGADINYVTIGQPKGDFAIDSARDQYGRDLTTSDASSGSDYKVRVNLYQPLRAGQEEIWFTLLTNVAHMIYEDTNTTVGMQFTPTWWPQAPVNDLRIAIVMPPNVTSDQVTTLEGVFWNGTQLEEGRLVVFFEKKNLVPDQRYPVGVAFPKDSVENYDTQGEDGFSSFWKYAPLIFAVVGLLFVFVIIVAAFSLGKKLYQMPQLSMETLGIRRGLTAVEASYLLDVKPTQLVSEILYSLLKKRAVWVESTKPSIKLKIMPQFQDKTGTAETPLRYYEIDFLDAIKPDGALDEEKLAHTVMFLRDTVEQEMRGYCRRDTVDYYRKIVDTAWQQVEQAGTAELTSNAYDEQLLWLLLDPNYESRTRATFQDRVFEPNPSWFWFWYGYSHYHPSPAYTPNIDNPAQGGTPPAIPGSDFANNVVAAVANTSNNIVLSLEKFANSVLPAPPSAKASHAPAHHDATCVCACHACACACACVSCACACASGGVG